MAERLCKACGEMRDEKTDFYASKSHAHWCKFCHQEYNRARYRKQVGGKVKQYKRKEKQNVTQKNGWVPKPGEKFIPVVREFGHVAIEGRPCYQEFWVCDSATQYHVQAGLFEFPCHNFLFRKVL
jgi:hypothetical protein